MLVFVGLTLLITGNGGKLDAHLLAGALLALQDVFRQIAHVTYTVTSFFLLLEVVLRQHLLVFIPFITPFSSLNIPLNIQNIPLITIPLLLNIFIFGIRLGNGVVQVLQFLLGLLAFQTVRVPERVQRVVRRGTRRRNAPDHNLP